MIEDVVLIDVADRVATVTLNRPDARNALNRDLRRAIPAAVRDLDADDGVDVIILTGGRPRVLRGAGPEGARQRPARHRRVGRRPSARAKVHCPRTRSPSSER